MPIAGKTPIGMDFIAFLRNAYTGTPKDDFERMMLELATLMEYSMDRRNQLNRVLDKVARTIQKLFEFRAVSIGLKDEEGSFKYAVLIGHPPEQEVALRKLKYDMSEMLDYDKYPNVRLGRISQYNPVEAFPENEKELMAHGKPTLPDSPRKVLNEFKQGDYMDFYMHGYEGKLLGWIEVSNTKDNKMPERSSVRWIELISDMTALVLQLRSHREKEPGT